MWDSNPRPHQLKSDNGPQFSSREFYNFKEEWKFEHITSSPRFAQSNGLVERAVQTAKRLITKCAEDKTNVYLALLHLRNTPDHQIGSPAQRLFGRRTQTTLPTNRKLLEPTTPSAEIVKKKITDRRNTSKAYFDAHSKHLEPLSQEDTVRVRHDNKWYPAKIISIPSRHRPRSYIVKSHTGRELRRNRKDILKTNEKVNYKEDDELDLDDDEQPLERRPIVRRGNRIRRPPRYLEDYVQ